MGGLLTAAAWPLQGLWGRLHVAPDDLLGVESSREAGTAAAFRGGYSGKLGRSQDECGHVGHAARTRAVVIVRNEVDAVARAGAGRVAGRVEEPLLVVAAVA